MKLATKVVALIVALALLVSPAAALAQACGHCMPLPRVAATHHGMPCCPEPQAEPMLHSDAPQPGPSSSSCCNVQAPPDKQAVAPGAATAADAPLEFSATAVPVSERPIGRVLPLAETSPPLSLLCTLLI